MLEQLNRIAATHLEKTAKEHLQRTKILGKLIIKLAEKISTDIWFLPITLIGINIIIFLIILIFVHNHNKPYSTVRKRKKVHHGRIK